MTTTHIQVCREIGSVHRGFANPEVGRRKRADWLSSWLMWSCLIIAPLTRQVPYHRVFSFGTTIAIVAICLFRKTPDWTTWRIPHRVVIGVVVAYLAGALASSLSSEYASDGFSQLARELVFFVVLLVLHDYVRTTREWDTVVLAVIWCGVMAGASLLVQMVLPSDANTILTGRERLVGVFTSPNAAGLVVSVSCPVALGYLQWKRYVRARLARTQMAICLAIGVGAALLTGSRSTLLAVLFSFVALGAAWLWKARYKLLLLAIAGSPLMAWSLPSDATVDLISKTLRIDRALSGRDFLWGRAWEIFKDYPILGTGPSTFKYYVLSSEPRGMGRQAAESLMRMYEEDQTSVLDGSGVFGGVIGNSSHNIWLDQAAMGGIVGVVTLAALFAAYTYMAIQQLRRSRFRKWEPRYWVVRGCLVSLAAMFLRTQFEPPGILRGALSESLLFWLTFLLVVTAHRGPCATTSVPAFRKAEA